jgi:hypothetical protein
MNSGRVRMAFVFLALAWLSPSLASAQTIAGVVKDSSGATVAGVTVEVESPALIEKSRTALTDASGQYKIVNLKPGTYTVTFTFQGFNTVKHQGIVLTTEFTAQVNAELKVGAITDTVTVSGETPVVDVQSTAETTVLTRNVLDSLPTGRNVRAMGILLPGASLGTAGDGAVNRDVGGSAQMAESPLSYRGSTDTQTAVDGMRLTFMVGAGPWSTGANVNEATMQEVSYTTGADSAEMGQAGLRVNIIPKDGGNEFHGTFFGNYSYKPWNSDNLDDKLRAMGIAQLAQVLKIADFNPSFNGPIKKNKLWFSGSYRYVRLNKGIVDSFYNSSPVPYRYVADLSRPAVDDNWYETGDGRLSWQASGKDKVTVNMQTMKKYRGHMRVSATVAPEAGIQSIIPALAPWRNMGLRWTRTQSSKLLFELGYSKYDEDIWNEFQDPIYPTYNLHDILNPPKAVPTVFSTTEQTTGKTWGAASAGASANISKTSNVSAAASYVTGTHAFKTGFTLFKGYHRYPQKYTGDVSLTLRNGAANSVTLRLPSNEEYDLSADVGIYAQDKWTIKRATINIGLRLDLFREGVPQQIQPVSNWLPETKFAPQDVLSWNDLSPRLGIAYDLFGNAKTVVKASLARFVGAETVNTTRANNVYNLIARTDTRTWQDLNSDFTIFNSDYSVQWNELGPTSNTNFGKTVQSLIIDPDTLKGWFKRGYTWEYAFGLRRELVRQVAVTAEVYHRWNGNQTALDNTLISASDFTGPFCVKAPTDARMPGGGGFDVCGLYDINPTAFGKTMNYRTFATKLGSGKGVTDSSTGFSISITARLKGGTHFQGGIEARRNVNDTCDTFVDTPEKRFCRVEMPFRPDLKFVAARTFWWDVQVSGTYQDASGTNILASWPAANSAIAPALGRNLSGGTNATKTISLIQPQTIFGTRLHQLDIRFSKRFRFKERFSVAALADFYNTFNSNWQFVFNNTYGGTASSVWPKPTQVLSPRMFKLGWQFMF